MSGNFTSIQDFENPGFAKPGEVVNKEIVYGIISTAPTFSDCKHKFSPVEFINQANGIKAAINFSVHYTMITLQGYQLKPVLL